MLDTSVFFITFEEYVNEFKRTSISVEKVMEPRAHAQVPFSF